MDTTCYGPSQRAEMQKCFFFFFFLGGGGGGGQHMCKSKDKQTRLIPKSNSHLIMGSSIPVEKSETGSVDLSISTS